MNLQSFGRYVLLRRLAVGGMAELWQARQPSDSEATRYVSLKRLLPHLGQEPRMVKAFRHEALIAGRFMAEQRWEATPEQLGQLVSGPGQRG